MLKSTSLLQEHRARILVGPLTISLGLGHWQTGIHMHRNINAHCGHDPKIRLSHRRDSDPLATKPQHTQSRVIKALNTAGSFSSHFRISVFVHRFPYFSIFALTHIWTRHYSPEGDYLVLQ